MILLGQHAAFEFDDRDVSVREVDAAWHIWIPELTLAAYGDPGEARSDVCAALGGAVCQLWCYGVCGVLDWDWQKGRVLAGSPSFIERTDLDLEQAITLCKMLREVRLGGSLQRADHGPGLLRADPSKLQQLEEQLESQRELRGIFGLNAGKLRSGEHED